MTIPRLYWTTSDIARTDAASATARRRLAAALRGAAAAALVLLSACASVPGETTAPRALRRDVSEHVMNLARQTEPGCKQQKILTTEMLEVRPDGQSAEEMWTVQHCGRRLHYIVSFPPQRGGARAGFSVRAAERP
jgi:hypothetical protein